MDLFDKTIPEIQRITQGLKHLIVGGAVLRRHYIRPANDIDVWIYTEKFDEWEEIILQRINQPYEKIYQSTYLKAIRLQPANLLPIDLCKGFTKITRKEFDNYYSRRFICPNTNLTYACIQDIIKIRRNVGTIKYNQKANDIKNYIETELPI